MNPVLNRELITTLRSKRALALLLAFQLVLGGFVMLLWPMGGVFSLAATSSHNLLLSLSMALMVLVCLCAPAFTAAAITREKEHKTYDMLYHTLMGASEIIVGKLFSGIGLTVLLILSSIPMMSACLILGGVSLAAVMQVYFVSVLAAVFFGLLGLYFSSTQRTTYRAMIFCYAIIILLVGGTWVPSLVLGQLADHFQVIHLLRGVSPFAAIVAVVNPEMFAGEHPTGVGSLGAFADSPWVFCFFAAVAGSLAMALSYRKVATPPAAQQREDTRLIDERMELIKRHMTFPFYLIDPRRRKRMIGGFFNVIFVKEMRSKAFARSVWVIRSVYLLLTISILLAFLPLTQLMSVGIGTIMAACVSLPLSVIILVAPVLTATAITEEREKGVFHMLAATRLSALTIMMGKLKVAWLFLVLLLISTLPTFFVVAFISSDHEDMRYLSEGASYLNPVSFQPQKAWQLLSQVDMAFVNQIFMAFTVILMAMVFVTVLSLLISALTKRSSTATALAYLLTMLWAVGTFIPRLLTGVLPKGVVRMSMVLNPFSAALSSVGGGGKFEVPPGIWDQYLLLLAIITVALMVIAWWRIRSLMQPANV